MKNLAKGVIIFALIVLAGVFCNMAAFKLPTPTKNIKQSVAVLAEEGPFFPIIGGNYRNSIADNNTDALMLLMANYDGSQNVLQKAVGGYYVLSQNTSNTGMYFFDLSVSAMQEDRVAVGTGSYSRYWHGWILPLRILLQFLNYQDIRYLSMVVILSLLMYMGYLLIKNNFKVYAIAYLGASLLMSPITAAISFEYSFVYYIILVHNIILIKHYGKIKERIGFGCYFLIIGCMVSYFDFLTYPIASLGFCMVTYLMITIRQNAEKKWELAKDVIVFSLTWAVGYIGMWISKWLIGSLVLGKSVWDAAIRQLQLRTSSTAGVGQLEPENVITYSGVLKNNWDVFKVSGFVIAILFITVLLLVCAIGKKKYGNVRECIILLVPFLLVFCMPFAWAFVFQNHVYIHYNFTSNIFIVSFLAIFSYYAALVDGKGCAVQQEGSSVI